MSFHNLKFHFSEGTQGRKNITPTHAGGKKKKMKFLGKLFKERMIIESTSDSSTLFLTSLGLPLDHEHALWRNLFICH